MSGDSEAGANIIFIEKHASYPANVFLTKMNALLPVTNCETQPV